MLRIGVIRDERFLEHKPGHTHPEHPHRLRVIYKMLDKEFENDLIPIEPKLASLEQLELVHTPTYIKKVFKTAEHNFSCLAPDTPASAKTYYAACLAAGGCVEGLNAVVSKLCDVCFCLVRPPGHHALADRAGGFCIFNNAAITARHAIKAYKMRRIFILDFDVHHGNGVNDLFYDCKEVIYMSTHDNFLYPYTGDWDETGSGGGEGYTINIPILRQFNDEDLFYIYREISRDVFYRFRPELIIVCAGFDAHERDPIGRSHMTEKLYGWLTHLFLSLRADINSPPLLFVLEGGYDFRGLGYSVREVLTAMTRHSDKAILPDAESDQGRMVVEKVRNIHKRYGVWVDQ
ncbi:Deacetylase, histone deacetylase/acetoin utilization protein [uncultured Desulfobacterium sp.]|uniref:Deacetylase, histone deacetylase/acetoin utilization protein n=1 Tax=uncultured Desulfobacterium sp. TaxID=201089 RepID=A0A445MV12_9BACT|nr:Deacetylase, histone deacetylase/acetoin utilization protein [uncultured Desulfobacterium sp.]